MNPDFVALLCELSAAEAGFVSVADLAQPVLVFQIGVAPCRIDLMTSLTGLTFQEAWTNRVEGPFRDTRCPYLGREALVRNKRAVGRPRDLADLEALGE